MKNRSVPVAVRDSKTRVLKFTGVSPRMNTIASGDQFKPIGIREDLVVNYKC